MMPTITNAKPGALALKDDSLMEAFNRDIVYLAKHSPAMLDTFAGFVEAVRKDLEWGRDNPGESDAPHFRAFFATVPPEEQHWFADRLRATGKGD